MKIIRQDNYYIGHNPKDSYFFQPETEEDKVLLAEFIKKIHEKREPMVRISLE